MSDFRFDHVHLRCVNPDATATFFETMFGAEAKRDTFPPDSLYPGKQRVSLLLGGQKILIAPTHPTDPLSATFGFLHQGLEHIGLTVDDLDAACAELQRKGADIAVGPVTRGTGLRQAFVRGPEGIMVELQQR
jgi:catechol 2,3-dioxygenase-like lactoylglutathione lyase family enzyme